MSQLKTAADCDAIFTASHDVSSPISAGSQPAPVLNFPHLGNPLDTTSAMLLTSPAPTSITLSTVISAPTSSATPAPAPSTVMIVPTATPTKPMKDVTKHTCSTCKKSFSRKDNLNQHLKTHIVDRKLFMCATCQKGFTRAGDLRRHIQTLHASTHPSQVFTCDICQAVFGRADNLRSHKTCHIAPRHKCPDCDSVFDRKFNLQQHHRVSHPKPIKRKAPIVERPINKRIKCTKTSLGVFSEHIIEPIAETEGDLHLFQEEVRPHLISRLEEDVDLKKGIKWHIAIKVQMMRTRSDGEEDTISPFFRSKNKIELLHHTIPGHVEEAFAKTNRSFEEFVQRGSGWTLVKVLYMEIKTAKYSLV